MRRLEIIEFLKGYAIFTIMIYHFLQTLELPEPFRQFISFGGTGVHLFVLLSGFGLFLSYLKKPTDYITFLKKRVSKIYIPYVVIVIISALISFFIPLYQNSLYAFGGHVFLYKMFDESIVGSYGYPLWFISMIIQFYIIFIPLAMLAKRINPSNFILAGITMSIIWVFVVISLGKESERVWNSFFLQFIWEFALGMVIALKYAQNDYQFNFNVKRVYLLLFGILGCASYGLIAMKGGVVGKMMNDLPALIGYSSLAIFIFKLKISAINKFFIYTGKISFSIYLLHTLILGIAMIFTNGNYMSVVLCVSLLVIYLASFYYQKVIMNLYRILKI